MKEKLNFGELSAASLDIGDIVEWSSWVHKDNYWQINYGIISNIENKIRTGRLVSVATVIPINGPGAEIEFFTASLRLVSKTNNENKTK
tara:strand:+ start:670 stop:936 length:267 start_codon:yes stop_codon:yes gene_type:complete